MDRTDLAIDISPILFVEFLRLIVFLGLGVRGILVFRTGRRLYFEKGIDGIGRRVRNQAVAAARYLLFLFEIVENDFGVGE